MLAICLAVLRCNKLGDSTLNLPANAYVFCFVGACADDSRMRQLRVTSTWFPDAADCSKAFRILDDAHAMPIKGGLSKMVL